MVENTNKIRIRNLTEGNIWKQLILFALPLILTNFLQSLYNTVDTIILGQAAGTQALAAVGTCTSLISLFIYFFIGFSVGSSILISQAFGAEDHPLISRLVHAAAGVSLVSGIILTVLGLCAAPWILKLMQVPANLLPLSTLYIRIYFLGMIPMMAYNMGSGILRAIGDTETGLMALIASAITNVALDCLFVIVLHMGVAGAAMATTLAQCMSAVIIVRKLVKTPAVYQLNLRRISLEPELVKQIIRIGLPTGLQATAICFSNIIVQTYINQLGLAAIAGYTSYVKLDAFLYMFTEAINLSLSNFVGQNVGAGKRQRIRKSMFCSWVILQAMCYTLCCSYMLKSAFFIGLFTSDPAVFAEAHTMMFIQAPLYFMYASMQIYAGIIRGLGKANIPMIMNLFFLCVVRIAFITLMFHFGYQDSRVIYWSYPLTWASTAGAYTIYMLWKRPIQQVPEIPAS